MACNASLLYAPSPVPPSPYNPMKLGEQQRHRHGSVAAAFMAHRQEQLHHAQVNGQQRQEEEVIRRSRETFRKMVAPSSLRTGTSRLLPSSQRRTMPNENTGGDRPTSGIRSASDEIIFAFVLRKTEQEVYMEEEERCRSLLLSAEELCFTKLLVQYLRDGAVFLAGDAGAEVQAAAERRATARVAMLERIENETRQQLAEQRMAAALQVEMTALLPLFIEEREAIVAMEAEDLHKVFEWEKLHRPLGAGCFIHDTTEEDPRLRYGKTVTKRSLVCRLSDAGHAPRRDSKYYSTVLQEQALPKSLVPLSDANHESEAWFKQDGKQLYAEQKEVEYLWYKQNHVFDDLAEMEEMNRVNLLEAQAIGVVRIWRLAAADVYEAEAKARARIAAAKQTAEEEGERSIRKEAVRQEMLAKRSKEPAEATMVAPQDDGDEAVEEQPSSPKQDMPPSPERDAAAPTSTVPPIEMREGDSDETVAESFSTSMTTSQHVNGEGPDILVLEEEEEEETEENAGDTTGVAKLSSLKLIAEEGGSQDHQSLLHAVASSSP